MFRRNSGSDNAATPPSVEGPEGPARGKRSQAISAKIDCALDALTELEEQVAQLALDAAERQPGAADKLAAHRTKITSAQTAVDELRAALQLAIKLDREAEEAAAAVERAKRIATTEKSLADRDQIAVKLETAIHDTARLYFDLIEANLEISRQWGMSANALRTGLLGEKLVGREVSHLLFSVGRPHQGITRFPAPSSAGLGMVGEADGGGLGDRIAAASRRLLEMIKAVPTHPKQDEAA